MKDYYAILGVQPTASQASIRDAYRRLAKQFHPDVNKAPDAEQIFKEINEAYEVLGDPEQRAQYDQPTYVFEQVAQQPTSPPHRDPAYRRPKTPRHEVESEAKRLKRLKLEYKHWFFRMCLIGLGFSFLIGVDAVLPSHMLQESIAGVSHNQGSRRSVSYYQITTEGGHIFKLYRDDNLNWNRASILELHISPIFSKVLKVGVKGDRDFVWVARVYTVLSFFPICLLLASLIGILGRKNIELLINCGTAALVIGLISLYVYGM